MIMKATIVGDVMMGGALSSDIEKYKNVFLSNEVCKFLEADITFCNLECPLVKIGSPITQDKTLLYAEEKSVELLKMAGFNIVSLANNHIMDFGPESLLKTIKLLEEKNIRYTGAGQNLFEARRPILFNKNGLTVAFLAYVAPETWGGWNQRKKQTHKKNWIAQANKPGVAPFDLKLIQEDIIKVNKKADFLIVSVHWGDEYTYFPHPELKLDAHKIIDMGANLIVGHHPHVLQGYEQYHGGLVMYSLSNFLFSPFFEKNGIMLKKWGRKSRESIILQCDISKNKKFNYKLIPVIQKEDKPVVINPASKTRDEILRRIQFLSSEYQKSNYQIRYIKLKEKENRFKYVRLILETIKTYGLICLFKKIWMRAIRGEKKR